MILAYAGVHRLGLGTDISHLIPFDIMLPAVGQGAVAIEVRDGDTAVQEVVSSLNHQPTQVCITAERAFLRRLEGGCQVPIGAHATVEGDDLRLEGMVGSLDGGTVYRETANGQLSDADGLGVRLAEVLIGMGADKLLAESRAEAENVAGAVI
jgi:hydroxymethylbilane synthase